jgi:hypothetical protein
MAMLSAALLWSTSVACAQDEAGRCGALPPAVAEKRAALRAAAEAGDYAALGRLADDSEFLYSFGDGGGDPVPYWRELEGMGTNIPDIVVRLLDMPCVELRYDALTEYVWPSANEIPYAELTPEEAAALDALYGPKLAEYYVDGPEAGYYVGWRLFIAEDGRWTALVAGD